MRLTASSWRHDILMGVLLLADQMLHADGVLSPGWMRIEGDRIVETGKGTAPDPAADEQSMHVAVLSPGFVDQHCHGAAGASFDTTDPSQAERVIAAHARHGSTSLVASLVTASPADLAARIATLARLVSDGRLAGVHLEGPCLDPGHRGAHDTRLLVEPSVGLLQDLAADPAVRMITLATELPRGLDVARALAENGVVVALGHTGADAAQTREAIDAGVRVATHLFNGMPGIHHRDPGPIPLLLESPQVCVEVIADGVHLAPEILALVFRAAPGRVCLVTDAMAAAAYGDGDYLLGTLEVQVRDGVARLAGDGSIAGSTLTMDRAVQHAVAAGVRLADALVAASTTPARTMGLTDVGSLAAGKRADCVLLDDDLLVRRVLRAGRWIE